jgi:hypothetical protein
MRGTRFVVSAVVVAAMLAVTVPATAQGAGQGVDRRGFHTEARAQMIPVASGVIVEPLMTAGDIVGGAQRGYQMSGTPDGLGMYRSSPQTIEVFMNHELALADGDASNARISHLTLNNAGDVLAASYPVDGSEGLIEFCSGTLFTLAGGVPWFFTGEEAPASPHNGTSIALNAISGQHVSMPWLGHMFHENNVPVDDLSHAVIVNAEDGDAGKSQLYTYHAKSFGAALKGDGKLTAWVPDGGTDAHPSPDDIAKGETLAGHFVTIPQRYNRTPAGLNRYTEALGAFNFVRIEDATADPSVPGVVYFADTGASGQETRKGRIYRLSMDPADPRSATLEVVLDADDAGDDLTNPDNLGISGQALVIQEDRNSRYTGYNRVLVYDLSSATLSVAARVNPSQWIQDLGGPGVWESSGVVDASAVFGDGWWLLDVQAHGGKAPQPGPSLEPNSGRGDGGQLLRVYIPGT